MTDTQEYQLRPDIDRVVRTGLTLAADETVTLDPETAEEHADVLESVGAADQEDVDDDQEASDSPTSAITSSSDTTEDTA